HKARGNGRFLLFRRAEYEAIGGHESVRSCVVEDEALAVRAKEAGVRYRFYFFPGLYRCRMYGSGRELWIGWRKAMFQAIAASSGTKGKPCVPRICLALLFAVGHVLAFSAMPYFVFALALGGAVPLWLAVPAALPVIFRQVNRFSFDRTVGFDA